MKVIEVNKYAVEVTTNEPDSPYYRRHHAYAWERCVGWEAGKGGDWCEIDGEQLEAAYQEFMQVPLVPTWEVERNAPQHPPFYRRWGGEFWQIMQHGSWERVDDPAMLTELEGSYQGSMPAPDIERDTSQRPVYNRGFSYRRRGPGNWEAKIAGYSWRPVVDPFTVRKLEYDYQKSRTEQDEEAPARLGISAAMTWEAMDMSEVAKRMKVQLSNLVAEAKSQAAEDDRALMKSQAEANTFAWEAGPDDENAKIQEAMEYLAWLGRRLYPCWRWDTWEGRLDYRLWECDRRGMKVRQWRGWGLSRETLLDNREKHGVILVLDEGSLLELWDSTPERKYRVARGIVQQTIENTYVVEEGWPYPQFIPTITEDPEEDAKADARTA